MIRSIVPSSTNFSAVAAIVSARKGIDCLLGCVELTSELEDLGKSLLDAGDSLGDVHVFFVAFFWLFEVEISDFLNELHFF